MTSLERIAANLRAVFASHVPLQFVDRRRLRPPHDIERDRLVGIATQAANLEVPISCVERVAERW
jgi:hypothetical protein